MTRSLRLRLMDATGVWLHVRMRGVTNSKSDDWFTVERTVQR